MELDLQKFFNESKKIQETLEKDRQVLQNQYNMDVSAIVDVIHAKCQQIQETLIQLVKSGTTAKPCSYYAEKLYEDWSSSYWLKVTFDKSNHGYSIVISVYNTVKSYGYYVAADGIEDWYSSIEDLPLKVLQALGQQDIVSLAENEIVKAVERHINEQCDTNRALGRR